MPRHRSINFPLSKEMARILRHGTKPREAPTPMNGDDGSVLIRDLMAHPSIAQQCPTETIAMAVAREVDEDDKLRFALYRESVTEEWRVRALNGHSLRIGNSALPPPEETPGWYLHGTTLEAAHNILKTGIRAMKRTHIHMIEYTHTPRGAAYLKNREKKQIWLTVDGPNAATAGIKFTKLENDVILSEGVKGVIAPCLLIHAWMHTDRGPVRLDLDGIRESPPVTRTIYNIPERGPPGLLPQFRKNRAEEANRRTPSPAVTHSDSKIPSVHEAKDDVEMSQRKSWRPVSPSPESLNLPEQERPPSCQEELLSPQLAPAKSEVIDVDALPSIPVSSKSPLPENGTGMTRTIPPRRR